MQYKNEQPTKKGLLLLVRIWNENRKSSDQDVSERAKEMLFSAFDSPQEMIMFMKVHNIEFN
jgi:hypothetical protein